MNTFRCIFIQTSHQVLVNIFCHKRNHRRSRFGNGYKGGVQSHISVNLILFHTFGPETFTASSDIPVTHIIYKFLQRSGRFRNLVTSQVFINRFYYCIQLGQQPFVHNRKLLVFQCIFGCVKFVNIGIQNKECVSIPKCAHEFTLSFLHSFSMETVWKPWRAVHIEVPADCISAVFFQCVKGVYGISLGFTHFLSVFVLYMTQHNNIFVRCFVKQQRRFCQQRVEPASCLVYSFRNKICRELLLKQFFVFKWIVVLCKRHSAGVKPAVNHFRYTVHGLAAFRTRHGNFVNVRSVQLYGFCCFVSAHFKEFLSAADGMHMSAFTFPYVQRRSPVTVTADTPVLYVFQPVAETAFSNTFRNPVNGVVVAD